MGVLRAGRAGCVSRGMGVQGARDPMIVSLPIMALYDIKEKRPTPPRAPHEHTHIVALS